MFLKLHTLGVHRTAVSYESLNCHAAVRVLGPHTNFGKSVVLEALAPHVEDRVIGILDIEIPDWRLAGGRRKCSILFSRGESERYHVDEDPRAGALTGVCGSL